MSPDSSSAPRLARADWGVCAVTLLAMAVVTIVVLRMPSAVGMYEDDGIYLVTSKALAEGRGYRHLELPGEPWQTKYPILYPWLLSFIWRVCPSFPANVPAFQVFNGICGGGAACLGYLIARQAWRLPRWLAATAALLTVTHASWATLTLVPMSEHLYAALSLAALYVACRAEWGDPARRPLAGARGSEALAGARGSEALAGARGSETPTHGLQAPRHGPQAPRLHSAQARLALLAATLAGLAFLSRSIGVTVIAAVAGAWLLRRRWTGFAIVSVAGALAFGGWSVYQRLAEQWNAAIPQAAAFGYDLDYRAWMVRDLDTLAWLAWHKLGANAFWIFNVLIQTSDAWTLKQLSAGPAAAPLFYAAIPLAVAPCLLGLLATLKRGWRTTHLYLALYLALLTIWPFDSYRFFTPLLPLLLPAFLRGIEASLSGLLWPAFAGVGGSELRGGVARSLAIAFALALLVYHVGFSAWIIRSPIHARSARQLAAANELVSERTPGHAVVAARYGGARFLATGRRFVPLTPNENPVELIYPSDRRWSGFGWTVEEGQVRAWWSVLNEQTMKYYRRSGTTHVLADADASGQAALYRRFRESRGGRFVLAGRAGAVELYELRLPRRPEPDSP